MLHSQPMRSRHKNLPSNQNPCLGTNEAPLQSPMGGCSRLMSFLPSWGETGYIIEIS